MEWSSNKVLFRLENEVIQEQIMLVNLVVFNGLYSKSVKKFQTRLMRSLKFRIIAMYKIFENKGSKTVGVDNINFNGDYSVKCKIYWEIVKTLREITYHPKNYKVSSVKRVWVLKSNKKKGLLEFQLLLIEFCSNQCVLF